MSGLGFGIIFENGLGFEHFSFFIKDKKTLLLEAIRKILKCIILYKIGRQRLICE